jgi:hypothetical protein
MVQAVPSKSRPNTLDCVAAARELCGHGVAEGRGERGRGQVHGTVGAGHTAPGSATRARVEHGILRFAGELVSPTLPG